MFLKNMYFKMNNHHNHFNNSYEDLHVPKNFEAGMMILKQQILLKVIMLMFLMIMNSIIVQLVNLVD